MKIDKEIVEIKKKGKLIAFNAQWAYWIMDGTMYSVNIYGTHYNIWCSLPQLNRHLHRLYQITGKKHFTDDPDMMVIDKTFMKQYCYA